MQNRTIRTILLIIFALSILLFFQQRFYGGFPTVSAQVYSYLLISGTAFILVVGFLYTFYQYTIHTAFMTRQLTDYQRNKENRYLDVMPEGVAIVDAKQQISYLNQAGEQLLDLALSPDNKHILSSWTTRFCESCIDNKNSYTAVATLSIDGQITGSSNPSRTITVQTRPLYDTRGKLVETISLFRDTSESSRKEKEQERVHKMAQQALAEREIFLANINHDIRTPLNAILGFSELLDQRKTEPDDHTYLEGIRTSGISLLALINELLDLSKIESGQLTLEPKPVLLNDILQTIAVEVVPKAETKNLQYSVQVDPDVPAEFLADRLRLTQVLLTIGMNAINFTDEGAISVTVQRDYSELLQQTQLVFTITDSGMGITADRLERIFDQFGCVSDQAMYRSGGTGLGLNIARSLVELMGGTISVQSCPGRGTTFCIRLPVDIPDTPTPISDLTTPINRPQSIPVNLKVLVVEDNTLNQKVMIGYLNRYQLTPTVVNNGLEAVEILKTTPFDLIFMDIQMPIIDGYQATETIRQQLTLDTPIVAMTAYTMAGEQERCLSTGMTDYLAKPIRMHQLETILARFMPTSVTTSETTTPTNMVDMGTHIVDEAFLNELMDGDDELLAEMVSLFLQDLPNYRQALFNAIEQQDFSLFRQTAHKFRSSLNSLAMLDTAKSLKVLETDTIIDPQAKRIQLVKLFDDIHYGLSFLKNRLG